MRIRNAMYVVGTVGMCFFLMNASCGEEVVPESGTVTLTATNSGETYQVGVATQITWTESVTNVEQIVVSYTKDNGVAWSEIGRVDVGVKTFAFTPTAAQVGDLCLIKVSSDGGTVSATSSMVFSVVPAGAKFLAVPSASTKPLELLYPTGAMTFKVGDVVQFKFAVSATFGYTQVVLKVSANEGLYPAVDINSAPVSLPARTFLWTVPESITSGAQTIPLIGKNFFQVGDYGNNIIDPDPSDLNRVPVTIEP